MAPRKPMNKRKPRRRVNRKPRSKPTTIVSQMRTHNAFKPKSQIFMKTQLCDGNPTALTYVGTGAPIASVGGITVGSMPDFLNIIALYNRYKIISCTYNWNVQPVGSGGLISFDLPKMTIRYNYDGNIASSSVLPLKFQDLNNVKQFQFTPDKTQFSYTYYPRVNEPIYLSGVSTGYKLGRPQYIDCAYSNVPHYGLMWYLDSVPVGVKVCLDITYKVAFKYQN